MVQLRHCGRSTIAANAETVACASHACTHASTAPPIQHIPLPNGDNTVHRRMEVLASLLTVEHYPVVTDATCCCDNARICLSSAS